MTAVQQDRARTVTAVPTFGRLLNTEFRRLFARRFFQVLAGLALLGFVAAVCYLWFSHVQTSPEALAQATAERDQQIAQFQSSADSCMAQPGVDVNSCGFVPTADDMPAEYFLRTHPFTPRQVTDYALAVGAAVAMAGFIVGATFIGAEWSSKNLVAWLFYEPRRLRLMAAKLIALSVVLLALAVLAQLIWLLTSHLLLNYRGVPVSSLGQDAGHFWSDLFGVQTRAALLVIPMGLLGFAISSLIRNTAAALGVAFVYFAVVESLVRSFDPGLQPALLTTNIAAWITHDGIMVDGNFVYNQQYGAMIPEQIHVSSAHGGVMLALYAAVALLIALTLFRRRDIA